MRGGLDRALAAPVGALWLEGQVGVSGSAGPYARLEGVWHPVPPVGVFGFGQVTPRDRMAGLGFKVAF